MAVTCRVTQVSVVKELDILKRLFEKRFEMNIKVNAEKIKKWRAERCWSQEHVAEIAGISLRTLQRIENGRAVSRDTAMALASAFEVDLSALTLDINAEVKKAVEREEAKSLVQFKMSFVIHLVTYILVIGLLLMINLASSPERLWIIWPAVGWGIGVVAHGATVYLVEYVAKSDKQLES